MNSREDLLNILISSRVTLKAFDRSKLRCRNDLEIKEIELSVANLGEYFCPWYYIIVRKETPKEIRYEEAECLIEARAMRVKEINLVNLNNERELKIRKYVNDLENANPKVPILLVLDTTTGKYFIIDGNKTSCALYKSFLSSGKNRSTSAILVSGPYLENIFGDFCIINRV